ncbi:MAG: hypothetical protein RL059_15 [Bacteroidota bacterium]|jgi:hypothetical protein
MSTKDKGFFSVSSSVFWVILGIILFLLLPYFKNGFYNEEKAKEWVKNFEQEKIRKDSLGNLKKGKTVVIHWAWKDFNKDKHEISFLVQELDILRAKKFRTDYNGFNFIGNLYRDFINSSEPVIDSMFQAMNRDVSKKKLRDMDILNYVVTAIQTPPYTKITNEKGECPCKDMGSNWLDDCYPRQDGQGCCNGVVPLAVYTPAEFIYQKTGDCDTKSILAYALLKKFKYDVAILVGFTSNNIKDPGAHCMLGVAGVKPIIPGAKVRHSGRLYYPWEVTSFSPYFVLGNVNMWRVWRDWEVVCN